MSNPTEPLLPAVDDSLGLSASTRGVRIVFKDLEYLLPSNVKRGEKAVVLKQMSGYMNDGEMTAIMGPSGCGKSMMMDVLAGRRSGGTIRGTIEYANRIPSKAFLRRITGYVEQFNTLLENLTVHEMLMYTAELTRPMTESLISKKSAVEALIGKLALGVCRDTKIGDPQLDRGISGGQAKRVNIGIALITQPRVLYMDEPISGLDSYTSNEIMQVVKNLVNDGLTLCATLHSPTPFTFNLFDKVYFLLRGYVVYFGDRASATSYFEAIAPESSISSDNDAEWLTDVVVKADTEDQAEQLASRYNDSEIKAEVLSSIRDIGTTTTGSVSEKEVIDNSESAEGPVTPLWFGLLVFLRYRSVKNFKDFKFWMTRVTDKIVLSILASSVYWGLGDDFSPDNFTNIIAVFTMWSSFAAAGASVYIPSFVMDRWLFYREHRDGLYRVITYFLVRMVEELIVAALISIMVTIIVWYAVTLKGSILLFFLAFFGNFCCSLALAFLVANLAPNMDAATGGLPSYLVSLTFFCGFFIRPDDIPVYLVWYSKIDFMKYSLGAFTINHFESTQAGRDLRIATGNDPSDTYGVLEYFDLDGKDKWEYTGYIYLMAFGYALLAYLVMQYIRYDRN
eukprot:g5758.t1